jgi:hypothetical protein
LGANDQTSPGLANEARRIRLMSSSDFTLRLASEPVVFATLEQIARDGARRVLQKAIEEEVAEYVDSLELALTINNYTASAYVAYTVRCSCFTDQRKNAHMHYQVHVTAIWQNKDFFTTTVKAGKTLCL